jgi:predicted deacetylase
LRLCVEGCNVNSKYLLRMDDACHTMDRKKWQMLEDLFDELGVRPIVAVVPDNRDHDLQFDDPDAEFWDKVRRWQAKGWTIAIHGYQHVMHHTKSRLVLPFYERSEFAGLSYIQQAEKIRRSWGLFIAQGVVPKVWIAPAHCFDWLTLEAIFAETTVRIVSDGIACDQYYEKGFYWIPQQLWSLKKKSAGLWTVCLHPNTMTGESIDSLRASIEGQFSGRIISLDDVKLLQRQKSFADHFEDFIFWRRHWKNNVIRQIKEIVSG